MTVRYPWLSAVSCASTTTPCSTAGLGQSGWKTAEEKDFGVLVIAWLNVSQQCRQEANGVLPCMRNNVASRRRVVTVSLYTPGVLCSVWSSSLLRMEALVHVQRRANKAGGRWEIVSLVRSGWGNWCCSVWRRGGSGNTLSLYKYLKGGCGEMGAWLLLPAN